MGASLIPMIVMSVLWGIVGIVLPFLVPKGRSRGIVQLVLILTAATCWLFWLCCYMSQMNPLIGPKIERTALLMMAREWADLNVFCFGIPGVLKLCGASS